MVIKVDTSVNEKTVSILKESSESLKSGLGNVQSDFSAFKELGLFTSQLDNIKKTIDSLESFHESFTKVVEENQYQWGDVVSQIGGALNNQAVASSGSFNTETKSYSSSESYSSSSNDLGAINHGISVKTSDVSSIIAKLDSTTLPVLLKKLYTMNENKSIIDLLLDKKRSGELLVMLKKILGDTTDDLDTTSTEESEAIQAQVLEKVNVTNVDIETEEGKSQLEEVVLENINNGTVDETAWNQMVYGDNTTSVNLLDGNWVVAKTTSDLQEYASYIDSQGVRQNSDTGKYSDYCLAFSYVHAYDLYTGARGSASDAGNYAHATAFEDYIDDDKNKILTRIYEEIMKGRPVVLQVNGNKAGTSRHFVTVVGFREGITNPESLTEQDLLIVDSWDGKIERMDTSTSRFMTTGADCGKEYSGYRLRVLKDSVAA